MTVLGYANGDSYFCVLTNASCGQDANYTSSLDNGECLIETKPLGRDRAIAIGGDDVEGHSTPIAASKLEMFAITTLSTLCSEGYSEDLSYAPSIRLRDARSVAPSPPLPIT
ncbi:MAG: hypothetical protein KGJ19_03170 [Betaproteobacteria bacterium]|nr:hypothetical protein [Betaproteobacteria bacterium]